MTVSTAVKPAQGPSTEVMQGARDARYLLRFDDICATMNWPMWERIEQVLVARSIAPILAVVPNNADKKLVVGEANPRFWDRVRNWQAQGWTIGLHGDQHRYVTTDSGIVGLNRRSEFAGLPMAEQRLKIKRGLATFAREGVRADVFVAPAHSFDKTTLAVLHEAGLTTVSDCYYFRPVSRAGMVFVPQQLWRLRRLPFGTWTVCYHHNGFSEKDFAAFVRDLDAFEAAICGFGDVLPDVRPFGPLDSICPALWKATLGLAAARGAARNWLARPAPVAGRP
jgi:predicted deacetylase